SRSEILRLADDRGVAHAHELVAHLDGDVLERALDHRGGDRVDAVGLGDRLAERGGAHLLSPCGPPFETRPFGPLLRVRSKSLDRTLLTLRRREAPSRRV